MRGYDDASSPTRYVPCVTVFRSLGTHWVGGCFAQCHLQQVLQVVLTTNRQDTHPMLKALLALLLLRADASSYRATSLQRADNVV
jgi:hypothetical protein